MTQQYTKHRRRLLLIALLTVLAVGGNLFSQTAPHVYLAIGSTEVTVGDTVALDVGLTRGDSIKTIEIVLNYDENRYRYLDGTAATLFQGATFSDIRITKTMDDSALYMFNIMMGAGRYVTVTAPGACFNLNFVAIDTGDAVFRVDSLTFITPSLRYFDGTADSLSTHVFPSDTFPPGKVNDFRVQESGSGQLQFEWLNPNDEDFVGVAIYRSVEGYLDSVDDDLTPVYTGDANSFLDTGLENNTIYYYSAFTFDEIPNYSRPVYLKAEPKDIYVFAYPNPFDPATGVHFKTIFPYETAIDLSIYDLTGQKVIDLYRQETLLVNDQDHELTWDGKNANGEVVANGVYYYVVKTLQGDKKIEKVAVLR